VGARGVRLKPRGGGCKERRRHCKERTATPPRTPGRRRPWLGCSDRPGPEQRAGSRDPSIQPRAARSIRPASTRH
jgi:hypothetical protein